MNSLVKVWPFISDDAKAVDFAFANHLLKGILRCKKGGCRSRMRLENDSSRVDGRVWRCKNSRCCSMRSIRGGSFFDKSNMSISKILLFIYLWCKDCNNKFIKEELEIDQKTSVDWSRFCRDIAVYYYENEPVSTEKIGGVGKIVEIDESVFSKRKYNRGRLVRETWVFGGVNRDDSRELFVEIVPDRTKRTLLEVSTKPFTLTLTLTLTLCPAGLFLVPILISILLGH